MCVPVLDTGHTSFFVNVDVDSLDSFFINGITSESSMVDTDFANFTQLATIFNSNVDQDSKFLSLLRG